MDHSSGLSADELNVLQTGTYTQTDRLVRAALQQFVRQRTNSDVAAGRPPSYPPPADTVRLEDENHCHKSANSQWEVIRLPKTGSGQGTGATYEFLCPCKDIIMSVCPSIYPHTQICHDFSYKVTYLLNESCLHFQVFLSKSLTNKQQTSTTELQVDPLNFQVFCLLWPLDKFISLLNPQVLYSVSLQGMY